MRGFEGVSREDNGYAPRLLPLKKEKCKMYKEIFILFICLNCLGFTCSESNLRTKNCQESARRLIFLFESNENEKQKIIEKRGPAGIEEARNMFILNYYTCKERVSRAQ